MILHGSPGSSAAYAEPAETIAEPDALRVLHITNSIGRVWGGTANLVADLALAQRQQGLYPIICTADDEEGVARAIERRPLSDILKVFPTLGPHSWCYCPQAEKWARSASAARFSVIHQHSLWTAMSRVTRIWGHTHGRPVVVAPHGCLQPVALAFSAWKKRAAYFGYERENLHCAACVQATSDGEAEGFRRFGLRNPVAVIPNPVPAESLIRHADPSEFRASLAIPEDARVMLFLSRIHPIKGLHLLIEALQALSERIGKWHLIIAGSIKQRNYGRQITAAAQTDGLAGRVHFVGPLYGDRKRAAFSTAEVFVLPTLSDCFGIVIAEALAAGLPVLTTTGAVAWTGIESGGYGWTTEPTSAALVSRLEHILGLSKEELRRMGAKGRDLVERHYLSESTALKCRQLYCWLLGWGDKPGFVYTD